jgi:hypothetical protein
MKRVSFSKANRSGNILHIETEGCIVNIRVNLHDSKGNDITSVEILPDSEHWIDGCMNNRVIVKESAKNE